MSAGSDDPLFTVVRGNPTEEELAALVAVFALRGRSEDEPPASESGWSAYWRSVRAPVQPGPEAWRMSGRPT
jgi:hypothetical protein